MGIFKKLFSGSHGESFSQETYAVRGGRLPIQLVKPQDAFAAWKAKRKAGGGWPLIVGTESDFPRLKSIEEMQEEFDRAPTTVLQASNDLGYENVIASRWDDLGFEEDEVDTTVEIAKLESEGLKKPSIAILETENVGERIGLVTIPCSDPSEIFAFRPFGSWNEVPKDEELICVLKEWNQRYGAVPLAATSDVLELYIDRPILDPSEAAKLAVDMYAFCPDIVDQGVETVHNLAQHILDNPVWYFWWD